MLNIRRYQWWKNKITPTAKRIVLSASIFALASVSLAFHAPLYNSDVSVEFDVVNKDGKSYYQYPKEDSKEVVELKKKKKYIFLAGVVGHTNAGRQLTFKQTDYIYTGTSIWVDEGTINGKICWSIKFTTSGTFTPSKRVVIDLHLVGGGAGGRNGVANSRGGGGGGGGYTGTASSVVLNAGQAYPIVIGSGGGANAIGGWTSFNTSYSVPGGLINDASPRSGGNGGSGGGGGDSGAGGSNGSNGFAGQYSGGTGQLTTTYDFGDPTRTLRCGGGGAGGGQYSYIGPGAGGAGGGANGGAGAGGAGGSAAANTGGGGGGGGADDDTSTGAGGSGGSGICIIRNARA